MAKGGAQFVEGVKEDSYKRCWRSGFPPLGEYRGLRP